MRYFSTPFSYFKFFILFFIWLLFVFRMQDGAFPSLSLTCVFLEPFFSVVIGLLSRVTWSVRALLLLFSQVSPPIRPPFGSRGVSALIRPRNLSSSSSVSPNVNERHQKWAQPLTSCSRRRLSFPIVPFVLLHPHRRYSVNTNRQHLVQNPPMSKQNKISLIQQMTDVEHDW